MITLRISESGHKPPRSELADVMAALNRELKARGLNTAREFDFARPRNPHAKPRRFRAR